MGIKDKQTYGEYYWAMSLEAQTAFAEEAEKELASMAANLMGRLKINQILPTEFDDLFAAISSPAGAHLGEIGGRFASEVADGAVSKAASPFFEAMGYLAYQMTPTKKMTPSATAVLFNRGKVSEAFFFEHFRMGGFEEIEARHQFDSMRPYPTIPDIITYSRYHGNPDNVWSTAFPLYNIDAKDFPLWEWLGLQRLTTLQIHTLYRRGLINKDGALHKFAEVGWDKTDRLLLEQIGWTIPNAMLLVQGDLIADRERGTILDDIIKADINPIFADQYLDAILTKPASQDVIAYELRRDPSLTNLEKELRRIGIHDNYFDLYKELAQQIPPVADIITMAVREAFTPSIAARFGQYEDFPDDLEYWGLKKGLSKEWTQRYWAAHWSLPSPSQGFEMLHRGLIGKSELNMLLRALDVMPFWREKLTGIAYRRLSRVDVRRMYQTGVLTEDDVLDVYSELGYNDRDAQRMASFTVREVLNTQSKFTARDVIAAYSKYMINRSEASSLLQVVGVRSENVDFILSTAEYKREWELTESRIAAIRNLYKKEVYTADRARSELLRLDMPSERVDVLMETWYIDEKDKPPRHWTTAQTLGFIKEGLITSERGRKELYDIGYDKEHVNIYMKASE